MTVRIACVAFLLAACAGCLSSSAPTPKTWMVSPTADRPPVVTPPDAFAVSRQGTITVNAPFDSTSFVVRRADGSVARDPYNVFASQPSALLRNAVRARLEADGRFGRVVPQSSTAAADVQVEVLVSDLSLDCAEPPKRGARAAVSIDVLRSGRRGRVIILSGDGTGMADAASGDYSAAFTKAFDDALRDALRNLREQPPSQPLEPTPKQKGENR